MAMSINVEWKDDNQLTSKFFILNTQGFLFHELGVGTKDSLVSWCHASSRSIPSLCHWLPPIGPRKGFLIEPTSSKETWIEGLGELPVGSSIGKGPDSFSLSHFLPSSAASMAEQLETQCPALVVCLRAHWLPRANSWLNKRWFTDCLV